MAIVSTELEVQDITTLPEKTSSQIDVDTDFLLGVKDNGVAYRTDVKELGANIVQGAKSNLIGKNQTVASAFRMLREETNEKIKESYGAPLVAMTSLEMKDKTRVYVYMGNEEGYLQNRWYYWNGTAWSVGGLYYSGVIATDDSLSMHNVAADAKAVGDALDELNTDLSSVADDVEQLQEDSSGYAASTSIAPEYSPSGIYAVGDYCMHDGALYRCTTAIATAEAWNASHWTADDVKNIANGLKDDVSDLKGDLSCVGAERVNLTKNGYYNLGSTINYINPESAPSLWNAGICEIVPCVPGDVFTITSTGTAAARNWAFLSDATSNNIISRKVDSANQYVCVDEMVVAPSNAAYAVFNANKNYTVEVRKGKTIVLQIKEISDEITNLGVPFTTDSHYATIIPANSDLNSYQTPGNYKITTIAIAQTVTNIPEIVGGRLTVFTCATDTNFAQLYIGSNGNTYIRVYSSNVWQDWNRIDNKALGNPIATDSTAATNVQSNDDFNNYTSPGNYKVTTFAIAQTVTNIPVVLAGRLTVLTTTANSSPVQIYIANNAACYIRIKVGSDWREWRYLTDEASNFVLDTLFTSVIADGTDINTIRTPGNYKVTNITSANTMSNLPEAQGGRLTVLTLGVTGGIHQWYISQSNNWYVRELISGNWSTWKKFADIAYVDDAVEDLSNNATATKSAYNAFKAIAEEVTYNMAFANAFTPLPLKNYLGNTQNVHPKVLYFNDGFGSHKYWMGYTPYPYSNDDVENPCVAYSDDGINFTNINSNPLDDPSGDGYDSDIHLVFRSDTNTLEAWFRYVGDASETVREETIYRRTSTDGITWTAKEKLYSNETGVISKLLSPSIEWDGTQYCIWVVRDGTAIDYYTAPGNNPTSWTLVRSITLSFVDDGLTVKPWHMDAIKDGNQYIFLVMCRNGTSLNNNRCSLFISISSDNIAYSAPVKIVGGADSWDRYMYRSSIVKVGNKYRIYYSAGSGGTTSIYNNAVWGIGITESSSLSEFIGFYY